MSHNVLRSHESLYQAISARIYGVIYMSTHIDTALSQAESLALMRIAEQCKDDLFYLCKYILGYDLMTEATHGQLAEWASSVIKPRSTRLPDESSYGREIQLSPDAHTKFDSTHKKSDTEAEAGSPMGSPTSPSPESGEIADTLHPRNFPSDQTAAGGFAVLTPGEKERSTDYQDKYDPDITNLLLLLPRGTFKSSVVTIGLSIQAQLRDPDCRILIDSETFSKAKAFLMEVKGHFESNDKLRAVYKILHGVYPDANAKNDIWSDSQINLGARKRRRKEPSISCGGVDVTKNGMHYDLIVMDDLMSDTNTMNKEQIEKVIQHYKLAISLLDPGCPLIVIGTRWHYLDVYQHILDNEAQNFNIMVRSAYNADGTLFFPERLTEQFLQNTKERQGSYIFSCQYLNEPVDDETATFKRSDILLKPWELVKDLPINWYLLVDPSFEGQYSDYWGFVIAGMDFQRQLYVRHVLRVKATYKTGIDLIFGLYHDFPIKRIAVETVATQKSLGYMLNEEQRLRGEWLPIMEFKSRSNTKEERIRGLAPYYENHRIFHVKECSQREELEYELLHFPKAKHDDVIDSLANILEIAQPASGGVSSEKKQKRRERNALLMKPRSQLTGY